MKIALKIAVTIARVYGVPLLVAVLVVAAWKWMHL